MKLSIREKVSDHLAFRDSAEAFFHAIEKLRPISIAVDFSGVTFMSRSFAHEYLTRKKQSKKQITETNVPENVRKMFHVVQHPGPKIALPKPAFRIIGSIDDALG